MWSAATLSAAGCHAFVVHRRRTYRSFDKGAVLAVRRTIRPSLLVPWAPPHCGRAGRSEGRARRGHRNAGSSVAATEIRGRYLLVLDLSGSSIAAYVALAIRFDRVSGPIFVPAFPVVVGLLLAVRTITNVRLGLYARRWRFASIPDLERIVAAVALGTLVALVIFYGASALGITTWPDGFPRSFWLAELLLSTAILRRSPFRDPGASDRATSHGVAAGSDRHATLLYGAGQTGVLAGAVGAPGSPLRRGTGRVPRRRSIPGRRHGRRDSRVRRTDVDGTRRRRDRCEDPAHHDAERCGQRRPACRRCRPGARDSRSARSPR